MLRALHPNHIITALDEIDALPPSYAMDRPKALRRVCVVLACVCVCLLFIHYAKFSDNLTHLLQLLARWEKVSDNYYIDELLQAGVWELAGYVWWTGIQVLGYLVVPALVIRFCFKERVSNFGWGFNETRQHFRGYLLLLSPILIFVYLASLGKDFVNHYPFYSMASRSWADFLAWEFLYLLQFVCLEFFFRGFILNALRPALGANAIWIMCVPYLMIHFPKLWLEATGAILFGLFLGILAMRSRSIWGGVAVHAGVALSMDIMAMLRKQGLPQNLWPF